MSLLPRSRLGPYEISSPLGGGGMGEVYRATDTRLDRAVAIKIISGDAGSNPRWRERFQNEARAVSRLNHPNICTLHDVGRDNGIDYLVMELLDGETLADRLGKRSIPIGQALQNGAEIADALDAAHRQGVVHSDVKPANIVLTPTGVKLLDFGIARYRESPRPAPDAADQLLSTASEDRAISGTVQYMSPEQLEGAAPDARSDIFSLGAVLYEMVTGRKAFNGTSRAGVIAAVLNSDVPPVSTSQPSLSPVLDRAIQKCLIKDPAARWQSATDLASELRWIAESNPLLTPPKKMSGRTRLRVSAVLVTVIVALAWGSWTLLRVGNAGRGAATEPFVFSIPSPPGKTILSTGVLSPDGRWIVFVTQETSATVLRLKRQNSVETHVLPGTEGGWNPFWSPDSRFIGFATRDKLKTVAVAGGPVTELATFESGPSSRGGGAGGTWGTDGTIVFAPYSFAGLYRVSQSGGPATALTTIQGGLGQRAHRWPQFLPDGRRFLFLISSSGRSDLYVGSLDNPTQTPITGVSARALYASPGYLLFTRGGSLMAQPFDSRSLRLTGPPQRIVDRIATQSVDEGSSFSASDTGVLAYIAGDAATKRLVWYDRSGKQTFIYDASAGFNNPALSPDETLVAASRPEADTDRGQLWLLDLRRNVVSRFAIGASSYAMPLWSRDGKTLVFASGGDLYRQASDGSGRAELLLKSAEAKRPHDWSPDGEYIVYAVVDEKTKWDIWLLPLSGDRRPKPFLRTPSQEFQGRISPDGRWIAYASGESGSSMEVYVQSFPVPGRKRLISTRGGAEPQWRRDGRELFYLSSDNQIMSVAIGDPARSVSAPTPLFPVRVAGAARNHYLVSADGKRFLVSAVDDGTPTTITVAVNWTSQLKQD